FAGVVAFLPNFPAATSGTYASFNLVPPLTPSQVHAMLFDLCYLNLRTSVFPGGEIRGQLIAPHLIPILELLLLD
ncbi:MAG: CHRD domain-containing protein, partial [Deltaproteobacteria bacterium]|nr:CHRD domain-containing protein [Deltaproteobacteria bacterium]